MSTPSEITNVLARLTSVKAADLRQHPPVDCQVQQWLTPEGAEARFVASHERPIFDLVLRFRAGSTQDGDTPGVAALALYSLDQGAAQLDANQFAEQLEGLGAIMSRTVDHDHATITLRSLSMPGLRSRAIELITAMVAQPAFRVGDVEKIKQRLIRYQQSRVTNVHTRLHDTAMASLFPGHPYGCTPYGTPAGVTSISDDQLRHFHQRAYCASNLSIGLVGDLSREQAEAFIGALSQALPQRWSAVPPPPPPSVIAQNVPLTQQGESTHNLWSNALQVDVTSAQYPALLMLQQILGASYESRLTQTLRVQRALTYTITSTLRTLDNVSLLQIHWDISPAHRDASQALVGQIVQSLWEQEPSQAECELALSEFEGWLARLMADNQQLAAGLAKFGHQRQPVDYLSRLLQELQSLTPATLREAAQAMLRPRQAVVVNIGPTVGQEPLPEPPSVDQ